MFSLSLVSGFPRHVRLDNRHSLLVRDNSTIVSNSLIELEKLGNEFLNIQYRVVDVQDWQTIDTLIGQSDVVVR